MEKIQSCATPLLTHALAHDGFTHSLTLFNQRLRPESPGEVQRKNSTKFLPRAQAEKTLRPLGKFA